MQLSLWSSSTANRLKADCYLRHTPSQLSMTARRVERFSSVLSAGVEASIACFESSDRREELAELRRKSSVVASARGYCSSRGPTDFQDFGPILGILTSNLGTSLWMLQIHCLARSLCVRQLLPLVLWRGCSDQNDRLRRGLGNWGDLLLPVSQRSSHFSRCVFPM